MKCPECQELLQERLDGRAIDSPELEAHLSQCATCREQQAAALRLLEGLKEMQKPTPRAGFAQTLAMTVINDRRERRAKMRRRVFLTAALAASVLFILIAAYIWMPRTPSTPLVKENPKKVVPTPKENTPENHVKNQDAPSPLDPLMDRVADATRNHAKVVLAATSLDAVENLPVKNLTPNPSVVEAGQEVSDGVRTVTRNARKAFVFFARELPMPDMGEQKN